MDKRKRTPMSQLVARSRKENRKDMPFLPREIIANILHWLPAEVLYDFGQYVCKTWNEILHVPAFAKSHLLDHEDCSLLIQKRFEPFNVRYVEIKDWKFKVKDLSLQFPGCILGSCDGLLLIVSGSGPCFNFFVANPVTMQVVELPKPYHIGFVSVGGNIASVPETGVFKVVCIGNLMTLPYHLFILTMDGCMSWREIDLTTEERDLLSPYWKLANSLSIDGVVYIIKRRPYDAGGSILAVDVRNESARCLKVPLECVGGKWRPVQMGKNLCCMAVVGNQSIEVRLLKDLYRNEWAKLRSINLFECSDLANSTLSPIMCLESQQVLVVLAQNFRGRARNLMCSIWACSLKTAKCKKLTRYHPWDGEVIVHTNSLVRIKE